MPEWLWWFIGGLATCVALYFLLVVVFFIAAVIRIIKDE